MVGTAGTAAVAGSVVAAEDSAVAVAAGVETVVGGGLVVTTVVTVGVRVRVVATGDDVVGFETYPLLPMSGFWSWLSTVTVELTAFPVWP